MDQDRDTTWAGVRFTALDHRDRRMFRAPGLYGLVRRIGPRDRLLLFAGHADDLSAIAGPAHPFWVDALRLGMNELHINLIASERLDRLQLLDRIVRRCDPLLNLLAEHPPVMLAQESAERREAFAIQRARTRRWSEPDAIPLRRAA